LDPPQTELQPRGAYYEANMSLCHENRTLTSGPCQAASKKTAEQLAARALLRKMSLDDAPHPARQVSEEDAARLQSENPKGRLLEWCAKEKYPTPQFEQTAIPAGFRVRAKVSADPGDAITSDWFEADRLKTGEQAAAEAVLEILQRRQGATRQSPSPETVAPTPQGARNAAMRLNELTQAGVLQATGYEVVDQSGPSHQPTFAVLAWASTPEGKTWRTEPATAPSKKSAQRAAADDLLELLRQAGVTGVRETSA
jgi:dsRNA-specific ribonuclease